MKYLKKFVESVGVNPDEIISKLQMISSRSNVRSDVERGVIEIDPDGIVNVNGRVFIYLPPSMDRLPVQFGRVTEEFFVEEGVNLGKLKTLEGCPYECGGFRAVSQNIRTLEGGPRFVKGNFNIQSCKNLTSLVGSPEWVGGIFDIKGCAVTSLVGGPKAVESYNCSGNLIKNLEGLPDSLFFLKADFISTLTSLDGIPKRVDAINISQYPYYRNLIWDPRPLRNCEFRILYTAEETPLYELINCFNTYYLTYGVLSSERLEQVVKNFKDSLDYNYIRGTRETPLIDLFRFKEALSELGIKELCQKGNMTVAMVKVNKLKHYQFVDESGKPVNFNGKL